MLSQIIPIIYYEGSDNWTPVHNFKERVHLSDVLGNYIPNFEYIVVPLRDYTNDDIIAKKDELSLVMLINKLKASDEVESFTDQIMRREFSMLFDSFEAYDVQAVRKESREEGHFLVGVI